MLFFSVANVVFLFHFCNNTTRSMENKTLFDYFTNLAYSLKIQDEAIQGHYVACYYRLVQDGEWFWCPVDQLPPQAVQTVPCYLLEELKAMLPLNFATVRIGGKSGDKAVEAWACQPDPALANEVPVVISYSSELEAVAKTLLGLVEHKFVLPERPYEIKKNRIVTTPVIKM